PIFLSPLTSPLIHFTLSSIYSLSYSFLFFFNDPPPTEIYTLSLHDALPICSTWPWRRASCSTRSCVGTDIVLVAGAVLLGLCVGDRKSTRLNSSHVAISYAVFCLKKKKKRIAEECKKNTIDI